MDSSGPQINRNSLRLMRKVRRQLMVIRLFFANVSSPFGVHLPKDKKRQKSNPSRDPVHLMASFTFLLLPIYFLHDFMYCSVPQGGSSLDSFFISTSFYHLEQSHKFRIKQCERFMMNLSVRMINILRIEFLSG